LRGSLFWIIFELSSWSWIEFKYHFNKFNVSLEHVCSSSIFSMSILWSIVSNAVVKSINTRQPLNLLDLLSFLVFKRSVSLITCIKVFFYLKSNWDSARCILRSFSNFSRRICSSTFCGSVVTAISLISETLEKFVPDLLCRVNLVNNL